MIPSQYKSPLLAVCLIALLAGGIGIGLFIGNRSNQLTNDSKHSPEEIEKIRSIPKPQAPIKASSNETLDTPDRKQINALASLHLPGQDPQTDIRILDHLFREVHTLFHELPTGDQQEIVAFLLGDNPRGLSYIPSDSPHLNSDGELVDRWGTPYFFHTLSRHQIEVRSAGPDKLHWSEDDVVSETVASQNLAHSE